MPGEISSPVFVPPLSAAAAAWGSIVGKPATFPPATHTHEIGQVTGLPAALATEALTRGAADNALAAAIAAVEGGTPSSGGLDGGTP